MAEGKATRLDLEKLLGNRVLEMVERFYRSNEQQLKSDWWTFVVQTSDEEAVTLWINAPDRREAYKMLPKEITDETGCDPDECIVMAVFVGRHENVQANNHAIGEELPPQAADLSWPTT